MTARNTRAGRIAKFEQLLAELRELRELDRRRSVQPPGSASREAASVELDRRSRRLMDRFRDLRKPVTVARTRTAPR